MKLFPALSICSLIFIFNSLEAIPWHASCELDWEWKTMNCNSIQDKLVDQINLWTDDSNCKKVKNGGEKCLYHLLSRTDDRIEATHTTPIQRYIDDLTIKFASTNVTGCKVHGSSWSETWYALLDSGTNYCNLHNLVTGNIINRNTQLV